MTHHAHEILSAIINHHSVPSTLQMVADTFVTLCPSKGVAIFLLSGPQLHMEAEAGLPKRLPGCASTAALPAAAPVVVAFRIARRPGWALPRVAADIGLRGQALPWRRRLISGSGEARGAFTVFDRQQGPLDDPTRETIQSLCDLARLAIEHGQLYEEVVHGSQFDRLTGLPNRTLLEDRLRQAMVIAKRQGKLLGVCCIDLDRFKQINDNLGYEAGRCFFQADQRAA